ncbi:MAG: (deoxy)nucleoside triphosphate pyrophosphohydrolase [Verrucomicrobia bacterium]|nr:(deoxy)nucleoside triphosphate pyrophosphohydrolase [Verrucomicrobiota bacterium]
MTEPDVIEVAAGLVFRNGRLLITRRRAGDHLGGLWEFPGGKRLPHESYSQCLQRELEEELGIGVNPLETIETVVHDYPGKRVRLEFFRCELIRGEPTPIECDALEWITRNQIYQFEFPAADATLLEKVRSTARWW